jgi:hypothetical protein
MIKLRNYAGSLGLILVGIIIGALVMSIMHARWDHREFHEMHTWYTQIRIAQLNAQRQREALERKSVPAPQVNQPEVK